VEDECKRCQDTCTSSNALVRLRCEANKARCIEYASLTAVFRGPLPDLCANEGRTTPQDRLRRVFDLIDACAQQEDGVAVTSSLFSDLKILPCAFICDVAHAVVPNAFTIAVCANQFSSWATYDLAALLVHELVHIEQDKKWGYEGFNCRYTLDTPDYFFGNILRRAVGAHAREHCVEIPAYQREAEWQDACRLFQEKVVFVNRCWERVRLIVEKNPHQRSGDKTLPHSSVSLEPGEQHTVWVPARMGTVYGQGLPVHARTINLYWVAISDSGQYLPKTRIFEGRKFRATVGGKPWNVSPAFERVDAWAGSEVDIECPISEFQLAPVVSENCRECVPDTQCPSGTSCKPLEGGSDSEGFCVSDAPGACDHGYPCATNADCFSWLPCTEGFCRETYPPREFFGEAALCLRGWKANHATYGLVTLKTGDGQFDPHLRALCGRDMESKFHTYEAVTPIGEVRIWTGSLTVGTGGQCVELAPGEERVVVAGTWRYQAVNHCKNGHRELSILIYRRLNTQAGANTPITLEIVPAKEMTKRDESLPDGCVGIASLPDGICGCATANADCTNELHCVSGATCNAVGSCTDAGFMSAPCRNWRDKFFDVVRLVPATQPALPAVPEFVNDKVHCLKGWKEKADTYRLLTAVAHTDDDGFGVICPEGFRVGFHRFEADTPIGPVVVWSASLGVGARCSGPPKLCRGSTCWFHTLGCKNGQTETMLTKYMLLEGRAASTDITLEIVPASRLTVAHRDALPEGCVGLAALPASVCECGNDCAAHLQCGRGPSKAACSDIGACGGSSLRTSTCDAWIKSQTDTITLDASEPKLPPVPEFLGATVHCVRAWSAVDTSYRLVSMNHESDHGLLSLCPEGFSTQNFHRFKADTPIGGVMVWSGSLGAGALCSGERNVCSGPSCWRMRTGCKNGQRETIITKYTFLDTRKAASTEITQELVPAWRLTTHKRDKVPTGCVASASLDAGVCFCGTRGDCFNELQCERNQVCTTNGTCSQRSVTRNKECTEWITKNFSPTRLEPEPEPELPACPPTPSDCIDGTLCLPDDYIDPEDCGSSSSSQRAALPAAVHADGNRVCQISPCESGMSCWPSFFISPSECPPPSATPSSDPSVTPSPSESAHPTASLTPRPTLPPTATAEPSTVPSPSASANPTPSGSGEEIGPPATATSTPTAEVQSDSVCFPASALVELEDGRMVRMDALRHGDAVRAKTGSHPDAFSKVYFFGRKQEQRYARYVVLRLGDGSSLSASPQHFVFSSGMGRMVRADAMRVGDWVETSVMGVSKRVQISAIEWRLERGAYNPHNLQGELYVNGIRASCYTAAVPPTIAHLLLAPFRMLCHIIGRNRADSFFHGDAPAVLLSTLKAYVPS